MQGEEYEEYWTDEQVAEYLEIKPDSVSSWAHRHDVQRRMRAKASDVVAAKLAAPGRGWRKKRRRPRDGNDHE